MLTFAVVAAKQGTRVPTAITEALAVPSPPELTFTPADHLSWVADSGAVAFGGWQADADLLGIGSHWSVGPGGVTAFARSPRVRGERAPSGSWAEHLRSVVRGRGPRDVVGAVAGMYAIVSIAEDGTGWVVADELGLCALYRAETDDVVVVSSSASLAAALVTPRGRQPRRDARAVASLVYVSYIPDDRTGFEAVRTIPHAAAFEFGASREPAIRTWDPHPWLPRGSSGDADLSSAVEVVRDEVAAGVRWAAERDDLQRIMELTGGKDSRVLLASAIAEGVTDRFEFVTWGAPHLPDQQVTAELAARYGLRHGASVPLSQAAIERRRAVARDGPRLRAQPSLEARIRHHVWLTSGALNAWERRPAFGKVDPQIWVSGGVGEGLRTNFPRLVGLRSMDELHDLVRGDGYGADAAGLLLPEARRCLDEATIAALEAALPPGGAPQDAIDGDYLARRMRRWLGTIQETEFRNRVFPLHSVDAIRAAFAIGPELRPADVLPFEVIRSIDEDLARHRLALGAWPELAWAGRPDAEAYRTAHPPKEVRRPIGGAAKEKRRREGTAVAPPAGRGGPETSTVRDARRSEAAEVVSLLRELTALPASHGLFEWLDRSAVRRSVDRFEELPTAAQKGVYAAMTAAMWIDGAEERYGNGR